MWKYHLEIRGGVHGKIQGEHGMNNEQGNNWPMKTELHITTYLHSQLKQDSEIEQHEIEQHVHTEQHSGRQR